MGGLGGRIWVLGTNSGFLLTAGPSRQPPEGLTITTEGKHLYK